MEGGIYYSTVYRTLVSVIGYQADKRHQTNLPTIKSNTLYRRWLSIRFSIKKIKAVIEFYRDIRKVHLSK